MSKKSLSERDICTKYITPALENAGCDSAAQIREEVTLTKGRIITRGKLHTRGNGKRAYDVLYYKLSIPLAVIEAKDNTQHSRRGYEQALGYAELQQVTFAFSSNRDGFLFHNTLLPPQCQTECELCLMSSLHYKHCGNSGCTTKG